MSSLNFNIVKHASGFKISLSGSLNEHSNFPSLNLDSSKQILFNLRELFSINSHGIRSWLIWISSFPESAIITFEDCPRIFIEQINMVEGMLPKNGEVASYDVPYFCENCENQIIKTFLREDEVPNELPCKNCEGKVELDVNLDRYLKFKKSR